RRGCGIFAGREAAYTVVFNPDTSSVKDASFSHGGFAGNRGACDCPRGGRWLRQQTERVCRRRARPKVGDDAGPASKVDGNATGKLHGHHPWPRQHLRRGACAQEGWHHSWAESEIAGGYGCLSPVAHTIDSSAHRSNATGLL